MQYNVIIDYTKRARIQIGKMHINKSDFSELINELISFSKGGERKNILNGKKLLFPPGMKYESTLYYFKVKQGFGLLVTIDEDPIFEQVLVKVFSVGNPGKIEKEFDNVLFDLTYAFQNGFEDEEIDFNEEENDG